MRFSLLALVALAACGAGTGTGPNGNNAGNGGTVTLTRECVHKNADGTTTRYAPPCVMGDSLVVR